MNKFLALETDESYHKFL